MKNKKAVSEMISYVILIAIAISISIGVFIWLKDLANVSPKIDCKDGTSLRLDEVTCSLNIITIKIKNNGNFNVNGFIIQVSDDINKIPIKRLSAIDPEEGFPMPGYYDFSSPLKPSDDPKEVSFAKEGIVEIIQIQPYIKDEKGKMIICEQALIKQDTSGCGLIPFDPLSLPSLISWWKFDEDAEDEKDINPGLVQGGVSFTNDAERGEVASFDGIDDYIDVGNGASLNITNAITIGAWVKPAGVSGGNAELITKAEDYKGYSLYLGGGGDTIQLLLGNGAWNSGPAYSWPEGYNVWYHIVGVWNGTQIRLYANGVDIGSPTSLTGSISTTVNSLKMGKHYSLASYFNGSIDDVMIFNQALNETSIKNIYCNEGGDC